METETFILLMVIVAGAVLLSVWGIRARVLDDTEPYLYKPIETDDEYESVCDHISFLMQCQPVPIGHIKKLQSLCIEYANRIRKEREENSISPI